VRGQQDRQGFPLGDAAELFPHSRARLGIEAGRRLIQEDDARAVDEAERDVQPPFHAARIAADDPVGCVLDPDQAEQLVHALAQGAAVHALDAALEHQVLAPCRLAVDARALRDIADCSPDRIGLVDDVVEDDLGASFVRFRQRRQHLDRRRLARAVRTEQAEDLSFAHAERDAVERLDLPVALAKPLDDDCVHRAESSGGASLDSAAVDLYEYQGKELFRRFGIPVSEGRPATTPEEARAAAEELSGQVVVKAQVLTGGRGKAGGVKLADDPADAEAKANDILGLDIRGHVVKKLWIERASELAKEYYLSVTFDRGEKQALFMLTTEGGVEIEEVAARGTDAIARLHVDPLEGSQPWQARRLIYGAGVDDPEEQKQILEIVGQLYETFVGCDAMLCEINPLIVTPEREVKALDSKFTVDDNALYKHPDIAEMRDLDAYPAEERAAREKGVTYVKLDGEVGILGNGAGLVMSTLDVIALAGGRPANFCDLGGGGDAQGVVDALEVITSDPQVKSIFFNIFGGITRCDEVARGILQALGQMEIAHPIVVRLDGTNADEGRRLLQEADAPIEVEPTMLDAAKRAVELAA